MSNQACQSIQLHRFVSIFALVSISLLTGKFHLLLILLICSSLIFQPQAHEASNERCPFTANRLCLPALHSSCFSWPREQRKIFHVWLKANLVSYPDTSQKESSQSSQQESHGSIFCTWDYTYEISHSTQCH